MELYGEIFLRFLFNPAIWRDGTNLACTTWGESWSWKLIQRLCSVVTCQDRGFTAFDLAASTKCVRGKKNLEMEN